MFIGRKKSISEYILSHAQVDKVLIHIFLHRHMFVVELYSSVSVGILFWQFANDVVPIDEAKRFYPLFSQVCLSFALH